MSSGTDTPFGLVPIRTLDGSDCNGMASGFSATIASTVGVPYNTSLIPGDPVTFSGTGGIAGPGIVRAAAGAPFVGVFGGIVKQVVTTSPGSILFQQVPSFVAGTTSTSEIVCWIYSNPNIIYAIQTNNTTGIAAADVGNNANVVVNAGNLVTNLSGVALDQATIDNTATKNLKIMGLASPLIYPGNVYSTGGTTGAYNVALVLINNHVLKGGTGTLGI